jgi:hypothetical protein
VSHKNVTKVVMKMVSVFRCQPVLEDDILFSSFYSSSSSYSYSGVVLYLTPETRHLVPKIEPCFVNYSRDTTLEAIGSILKVCTIRVEPFYDKGARCRARW